MLYVGFREADITPKPGSQSPGGMTARKLEKVHDPLKVVAMVLKNDDLALAIVGVDAVAVTEEITRRARDKIADVWTKIPAANIMIGASHTHSGGPIVDAFESEADPEYVDLVVERIVEAVSSAWNSLHAAEIGVGKGREENISFNRRFLMKDASQITHPGKNNPEIVAPAGPIDPDVGVLAARSAEGHLLGVFVNFSCHATVMSEAAFSADYIGSLRETLRDHYKIKDLPVGFLLGAAGDVTQVDNRRIGREFGPEWSNMFGLALGAEVIQAVARMEWKKHALLNVMTKTVTIPIRAPRDPKVETPMFGLGSGDAAEKAYARERELLEKERAKTPNVTCEVQSLRIGDLGIVSNGAEFFCELGLEIKQACTYPNLWVATLANQHIGYVATGTAYYAGGYEVRTARSAKLIPEAGRMLVKTSLEGLSELD